MRCTSNTLTDGIRVEVAPFYLPGESDPGLSRFAFGYHITISNEGDDAAQLMNRRWTVVDANGHREEVHGPGVVGYSPRLEPGEEFRYTSYCPLESEWGTMEGTYQMRRDSGSCFDVPISRFHLNPLLPKPAPQLR